MFRFLSRLFGKKHPSCPRCRANQTIPIRYGLPGPELLKSAERKEVMLGGCIVGRDDPQWACRACGAAW